MQQFTIGSVLYRDYRSGSVHDFGFQVGSDFFRERGPYLSTAHHPWDKTIFLDIRLSADWLVDAYTTATQSYLRKLQTTKKLPLELYLELCDLPDELEYLDGESVDVGRQIRLAIEAVTCRA